MRAIFTLRPVVGAALPAAGQTEPSGQNSSGSERAAPARPHPQRVDADTLDEVFDLTLPGAAESITIRSRWTRSIP